MLRPSLAIEQEHKKARFRLHPDPALLCEEEPELTGVNLIS